MTSNAGSTLRDDIANELRDWWQVTKPRVALDTRDRLVKVSLGLALASMALSGLAKKVERFAK